MATATSATKRLRGWLTLRRARRWLGYALALWTVMTLLLVTAIFLFSRADHAQEADVIVILGAGLDRGDRPGPALIRRTAKGAHLWREGLAAQIICTGGFGLNRSRSEADACAELLRAEGVPAEVILLEDRSRSTEENALYTLETLQANGWNRIVLVSDGYHLLRAHWLFNNLGIENFTSPAVDPPLFNHISATLREIAAFHWLAFKMVFNIPVTYVPVL